MVTDDQREFLFELINDVLHEWLGIEIISNEWDPEAHAIEMGILGQGWRPLPTRNQLLGIGLTNKQIDMMIEHEYAQHEITRSRRYRKNTYSGDTNTS